MRRVRRSVRVCMRATSVRARASMAPMPVTTMAATAARCSAAHRVLPLRVCSWRTPGARARTQSSTAAMPRTTAFRTTSTHTPAASVRRDRHTVAAGTSPAPGGRRRKSMPEHERKAPPPGWARTTGPPCAVVAGPGRAHGSCLGSLAARPSQTPTTRRHSRAKCPARRRQTCHQSPRDHRASHPQPCQRRCRSWRGRRRGRSFGRRRSRERARTPRSRSP